MKTTLKKTLTTMLALAAAIALVGGGLAMAETVSDSSKKGAASKGTDTNIKMTREQIGTASMSAPPSKSGTTITTTAQKGAASKGADPNIKQDRADNDVNTLNAGGSKGAGGANNNVIVSSAQRGDTSKGADPNIKQDRSANDPNATFEAPISKGGARESNKATRSSSKGVDKEIKALRGENSASGGLNAPPSKGGSAKGAYSYLTIDNWTRYYVDIYLDGYFAGTVAPWGELAGEVVGGSRRLYAKATFNDGSFIYWGPRDVYLGSSYTWRLDP